MNRFNLTEWAIKHRSVVIYFMLVVVIAGGFLSEAQAQRRSGLHRQDDGRAGRVARSDGQRHAPADHRPPRAQASGDAEPGLPEELTTAGNATVFVYLKDSTRPAQVPDIWY